VKDELERTRHELSESNEAREASEMCVKVLREFIGENDVGVEAESSIMPLKLPPPPTMAHGDEEENTMESKTSATTGSWGFRLWGETAKAPPSVPRSANSASASPQLPHVQLSASTAPLSRKIGGFFSSRSSSISSVASTNTPLARRHATPSIRESASASDGSSIVEPVSPTSEDNHLVLVRDVTTASVSSIGNNSEHEKEIQLQEASHT